MIIDVTNTLVIDPSNVRSWCKLPYIHHPHGCPNFNKSDRCPPKIGLVDNIFDLSKQHWFIVEEFDLKAHREKMLMKHPDWSYSQANCCLYWQGHVKSRLKNECMMFCWDKDDNVKNTLCVEAMGVNVFETCAKHGLILEHNPKDVVYKIAFIGYEKDNKL